MVVRDWVAVALAELLVLLFIPGRLLADNSTLPPEDFKPLFNGVDLAGWWGLGTVDPAIVQGLGGAELQAMKQQSIRDIERHWRVENGELVNDGKGLFLTTEKQYRDFKLLIEYKTVPGADSGIYLRGIPQVQIWDHTALIAGCLLGASKGSGGLWNNTNGSPGQEPLVLADKPFGEWNQLRITMIGENVTVVLNDHLVVDHARMENYFNRGAPLPEEGPIQLQTHGGEIRWRNLYIHEIKREDL